MKSEGNIIGFASFYYHSDHLGSSAYLTNDSGQVTQILNYLPYGEDWVDIQNNLDPSLGQYTFNGKEKDHESGFHYYGARYYWSEVLTGWLSVDPMLDNYPSISPYAYCAWNPVKLVDPDGCIVVPAENSTPQFVEYINQAKLLLCQKGAANILYQLEVLPIIIKIQEITYAEAEAGRITHKSGVISWCPTAGLTTTENVVISPTTILNHEFDHALQGIHNPKQKAQDKATEDYNYDNAEERRVIAGSEQETAIKLGEILPGQITRDNHLGKTIPVESPTSTDVKIPFRISPCGTVIDEITVN